jgi:ADP-ribose pyrophosphatase YjhB (NUDIX family)
MTHLSLGLLVYTTHPDTNERVYHLVQRRDSYHYIAFLIGKTTDPITSIKYMTDDERQRLRNYSFDELIVDLFPEEGVKHLDYVRGKKLFDSLDIEALIKENPSLSPVPQWVIPKGGRKNSRESPIVCALREYKEETLNRDYLSFLDQPPIKNEHIGTDGKLYRVFYFVAEAPRLTETYFRKSNTLRPYYVTGETSDVIWATSAVCQKLIPGYLTDVFKIADTYNKENSLTLRQLSQRWTQEVLKREYCGGDLPKVVLDEKKE